jgi:hypothetical protein
VPAVHARPYCHICSGCSTHACACIEPPSGVYSRFHRQITTLSCGPKSWCAAVADRENYSRCLCHCSSSELSYKRTQVLFGGLAPPSGVFLSIAQACYRHSCSPPPLSMLSSVLCFAGVHLHFDAVVGSLLLDVCVVLFSCVRLLVGTGKALGVTQPCL